MADTPTTEQAAVEAVPAAAPAAAPTAFKVSVEHFATQLSGRDKRVALIHGWVHTEKAAGRMRDFASNYQARYEAFAHQPV